MHATPYQHKSVSFIYFSPIQPIPICHALMFHPSMLVALGQVWGAYFCEW